MAALNFIFAGPPDYFHLPCDVGGLPLWNELEASTHGKLAYHCCLSFAIVNVVPEAWLERAWVGTVGLKQGIVCGLVQYSMPLPFLVPKRELVEPSERWSTVVFSRVVRWAAWQTTSMQWHQQRGLLASLQQQSRAYHMYQRRQL